MKNLTAKLKKVTQLHAEKVDNMISKQNDDINYAFEKMETRQHKTAE